MTEKLEKLKELLKLADSGLTREEFTANFKIIIDLIKELKRTNALELGFLDKKYTDIVNKISSEQTAELASLEAEVMDYCEKQVNKVIYEHENLKSVLEKRMSEIRNGADGKDGIDGLDGSPDTPEEIIDKISGLIEIEDIKGLKEMLEELRQLKRQRLGGGGFSKIAMDQHFVDDETPVNSGDDLNFTINQFPNPLTSLKVYRNGQRLKIGATNDYTFSGKTITLLTALGATEILLVDYKV